MATLKSTLSAITEALKISNVTLTKEAETTLINTLTADFARSTANRTSETSKLIDGEMLGRCSRTGLFLPMTVIVEGKNISRAAQSWVSQRATKEKNAEAAIGSLMADSSKPMAERLAIVETMTAELDALRAETLEGIEGAEGLKKALNAYLNENMKYKQGADTVSEALFTYLQEVDLLEATERGYISTADLKAPVKDKGLDTGNESDKNDSDIEL